MRGLLADVNVQGRHLKYLREWLEALDLWPVLTELQYEFATLFDLHLPQNVDDRSHWNRCQQDGWILLTDNRNLDGENSLQATLNDSWRPGFLPILTLANKQKFERDADYAKRVAIDIAEVLFGISQGEYRNHPRIYVPIEAV